MVDNSDALSKGFPFDLGDLWQESSLNTQNAQSSSLFEPLETNLESLGLDNNLNTPRQTFDLELSLDFENVKDMWPGGPGQSSKLEAGSPKAARDDHKDLPLMRDNQDQEHDLWDFNLASSGQQAPVLYSWQAFENLKGPQAKSTFYISESGAGGFDAMIARSKGQDSSAAVLPQAVTFKALVDLALGRSSIFFQWDADKRRFTPTLPEFAISGLSHECTQSFVEMFADCGAVNRALNAFVNANEPRMASCTANVALRCCVSDVLDSVDQAITPTQHGLRSFLHLQRLVSLPYQLLSLLHQLVQSTRHLETDEMFISALADQVHQSIAVSNPFADVLRNVLARVSAPWLERLSSDLGVGRETTTLLPDDGRIDSMEKSHLADADASSADDMPSFVRQEDKDLIRDTKATIRILRQQMQPSDLRKQDGREKLADTDFATTEQGDVAKTSNSIVADQTIAESLVWADSNSQLAYLADLEARLDQQPNISSKSQTALQVSIMSLFDRGRNRSPPPPLHHAITAHFDPLELLRPGLRMHNRYVNETLLRYLFNHCNLRRHLDVQRQFHLFGNGRFVQRLSTALFSHDAQSAERRKGNIPTSDTMGLRLGASERRQWPPASSELRLTLMGILNETYNTGQGNLHPETDAKDLPGKLSFSIRELPEKEIEKVMDASSLYALDFLRLAYTAPAPLDAVLTASSLQDYDSIFRLMLKLNRVIHVTTKLSESSLLRYRQESSADNRSDVSDPGKLKFIAQAHHLVSVVTTHFIDIGIKAPWRNFIDCIDSIEASITNFRIAGSQPIVSGVPGLAMLQQLHANCLESIRARLFLRRKQDRTRNLLEQILSEILKFATMMQNEVNDLEAFQHTYRCYEQASTEFSELLRSSAAKVSRPPALSSLKEDDAESMTMLLSRLEWNEHRQ